MGVPTIGGETSFEECYAGNNLVNAFTLGLAKTDEIFMEELKELEIQLFMLEVKQEEMVLVVLLCQVPLLLKIVKKKTNCSSWRSIY